MPKIIKNIKENIIIAAIELFESDHYEAVDMKMIAKKSGIAVGTLYNYYSNKRDLFSIAFDESWKKTISKLEEIEYEDGKEIIFIEQSLERLYDGILEKKYMFHELMSSNPYEMEKQLKTDFNFESGLNEKACIIKRELLLSVEQVLIKLNKSGIIKIPIGMEERFVSMLFMEIWALVIAFSDEREKNIKFLNKMVEMIFI